MTLTIHLLTAGHMLPAQLANVAAAALPKPPIVQAFFGRLADSLEPRPIGSGSKALLGDTFPEDERVSAGTEKNQKSAYHVAMDFMKVLHDQNVTITDLDKWMAGRLCAVDLGGGVSV